MTGPVATIMDFISNRRGVSVADLSGPCRLRSLARPRQEVCWISRRLTERSYPEIAQAVGNRDHTTVMHAERRIDALMAKDSDYFNEMNGMLIEAENAINPVFLSIRRRAVFRTIRSKGAGQ